MYLQTKYDMIIYDIKIELMEALFKQKRNAIKNYYSVNILYIFQFQTTLIMIYLNLNYTVPKSIVNN